MHKIEFRSSAIIYVQFRAPFKGSENWSLEINEFEPKC